MDSRKRIWFEESGNRLDPGLIEQLRISRKSTFQAASSSEIPVIIKYRRSCGEEEKDDLLRKCNIDSHNHLEQEIRIINSTKGQLTPEKIKEVKDHEAIERIYYDRPVSAYLDITDTQIGARGIREKHNLSGKGVTIAVLDTGIHPHADLTTPENRLVAFRDLINGETEPYDDNGHGTHCAGDAAGNGASSDGAYQGPAPESSVVGVKVLDGAGDGKLSTIIGGIEWCLDNKETYDIRILSLSLGGPAYESFREDPLSLAAQEAWHRGMIVCAAAGNSGPAAGTTGTPGINPFIITVGASDDQDTVERSDDAIAEFSSRGPTIDQFVKPDIYAPGTNIISLLSPGSAVETELAEQIIDEDYIQMSGTSMATPVCAGVIALMLEANPDLSPNDVKSILQMTGEPVFGNEWGYIDAESAVEMAIRYAENQHQSASMDSQSL
ncbi:S8 family peptidase [Salinicoccus hispanicus]|uniref:S8 family serine peptidase n=1 Tax=Salinicoccus hispanicus TaxID=157225 RepID=A0A6N8U268_9STAP|nr:S8 family peptidase [Salinicoccus hispanicus]MXQ51056.1 S8 family serine peptidase [Salinicoccus hispanicus]